MAKDYFYDLDSARKTLDWLKDRITTLSELGKLGQGAMASYDLDSAESYTVRINEIMDEINSKGIILRDLGEVLVDFPAVINNIPSYFCWTGDEDDIQFWHYADEGFAGRRPITGKESILSYL